MKISLTIILQAREGTTIKVNLGRNLRQHVEINTHTRWSGREWHLDKDIVRDNWRFTKGHHSDYQYNKARDLFGHKVLYARRNMLARQFARCIQCGLERNGADEFNGYPCKEPKQYTMSAR